jgi:hypothetical protein
MKQGNQKTSTTYKQNTKRTHKKQYTTHYDEDRFYYPGSIPGHYKKWVGLERGPLSLVSTTEELLDRKVAAPV